MLYLNLKLRLSFLKAQSYSDTQGLCHFKFWLICNIFKWGNFNDIFHILKRELSLHSIAYLQKHLLLICALDFNRQVLAI